MFFIPARLFNRQFFEALSRLLIRHTGLYVALAVLLSIAAYQGLTRLTIDSNYIAFLPDSFPGVQNLKKVIEKTGGFGNFMLILEGGTPEARRTYAEAFALKARMLPWVDYAEFNKEWEKTEQSRLLFLNDADLVEIRDRLDHHISFKKNPLTYSFMDEGEGGPAAFSLGDLERQYAQTSFGSPYFEDPKELYTLAIIWPKGSMTDMKFSRAAYKDLTNLIEEFSPRGVHQDIKANIGGEMRNKIDEYDSLLKSVASSSSLTLGVIALLLFVFYRRIGAVFYTLLPMLMGSLWCAGLAFLLVGSLNLLTLFLVCILFGIGIDYGIFMFSRYLHERRNGLDIEQAIAVVLSEAGKTVMLAAWTTALAFATLCFTDFRGFYEFGLLASVSIIILFFTFFIYSPIIWILAERAGFLHPDRDKKIVLIPAVPLRPRILLFFGVLSAVGLFYMTRIDFEYDYANLRSRISSYWRLNTIIHAVFPLSKTPAVVITDSMEEADAVVSVVREKIPQSRTIDTVKSLSDFTPQKIDQKRQTLAEIKNLILANQKYLSQEDQSKIDDLLPLLSPPPLHIEDLSPALVRQFSGLKDVPGHLVFIYDKVRLSDSRNAREYADDIRAIKTGSKTYYPAEGSMIFADTLDLMKKESLLAFLFMIGVVALNLFWDFKSVKKAVIVFSPLIVGLVLMLGIMGLTGLKLNIFNLIIFPILIGMGDDASLLLYHRVALRPGDESFAKAFREAGTPILLAGLTTMVGFGSLIAADHQGLDSLGSLALIGITCNLVACLFFFPTLLYWLERRKG